MKRSFRISCSHPENVLIENDIVVLSGFKAVDIAITFLTSSALKLPEVFPFSIKPLSSLLTSKLNFWLFALLIVKIFHFLYEYVSTLPGAHICYECGK